ATLQVTILRGSNLNSLLTVVYFVKNLLVLRDFFPIRDAILQTCDLYVSFCRRVIYGYLVCVPCGSLI
ncbi:hypothetical protein, partial [Legionella qingyii]|uniref:hypothetical protein n=1 Tax=Legionella qingyii TaxID=2184757 RepID=UPI00197C9532